MPGTHRHTKFRSWSHSLPRDLFILRFCHREATCHSEVKIEVEQSSCVESVLNLGVFWPLPLAKKRFGDKIPKADITTHKHKGITFTGVRKELEHGNPVGTFLLQDIDSLKVKRTKEVTNSDVALRGMEEINEIFDALRSRTSLKVITIDRPGAIADCALKTKLNVALDDGLDDVWACDVPCGGMVFLGNIRWGWCVGLDN